MDQPDGLRSDLSYTQVTTVTSCPACTHRLKIKGLVPGIPWKWKSTDKNRGFSLHAVFSLVSDVKCWNRSIPSYGDLSRSIISLPISIGFRGSAKRRRMGRSTIPNPSITSKRTLSYPHLPNGISPLLQLKVRMKMKELTPTAFRPSIRSRMRTFRLCPNSDDEHPLTHSRVTIVRTGNGNSVSS